MSHIAADSDEPCSPLGAEEVKERGESIPGSSFTAPDEAIDTDVGGTAQVATGKAKDNHVSNSGDHIPGALKMPCHLEPR